ncbi:MAG: cytoplasmic protein [Deltaproteobacteria bacterium]|nr:cytoplasmic protein [Deltaproteobacteria bacterium]MBW2016327.1 cytoplasmic protein [Deltaproteobacteria bacterium]MBW2303873.1 cytoplasmic protein [Deltaproteobacteria bacterium]
MPKHHHRFVEKYDGLVGFGLSREVNEYTLTYYLQKFSDDDHMSLIRRRMSDEDLEGLFNLLGRLLKTYLTEKEYHRYFLKDED